MKNAIAMISAIVIGSLLGYGLISHILNTANIEPKAPPPPSVEVEMETATPHVAPADRPTPDTQTNPSAAPPSQSGQIPPPSTAGKISTLTHSPVNYQGKWEIPPDAVERLVRVDISHQRATVYEQGQLKYEFTCSTSSSGKIMSNDVSSNEPHDHVGVFSVIRKVRLYRSRAHDVDMPYAVFYHDGHALHATSEIGKLGRPASHGCIRLRPHDAQTLFHFIQTDDPVEVR